MDQDANPMNIEHWLAASVSINVLLFLYAVYLTWWSSQRELHIKEITRKVVAAIDRTSAGYSRILRSIKESHGLSREGRREILDVIKETKREQNELVLDIEERLSRSIDRRNGNGVTNQISTGGGAANQAGSNHNEQR